MSTWTICDDCDASFDYAGDPHDCPEGPRIRRSILRRLVTLLDRVDPAARGLEDVVEFYALKTILAALLDVA